MGYFSNFQTGGIPRLLLGSATDPYPSRNPLPYDSGTCQSACSANNEVQPKSAKLLQRGWNPGPQG
jgi:hypothetical protein